MYKSELNKIMEFDHVIKVNPDLTLDENPEPHVYAPECVIGTDENGQILPSDEAAWLESLKSQGWDVLKGYSRQYSYNGPIMDRAEYIGGALEDDITDKPGLYVVCSVETLDDSEDAAGWIVAYREIELPVVSYRCPCCGDDVMDSGPVCSDCELAGCVRTTDAGGDRNYFNCERDDTPEYHLQFCDREANRDITGDVSAERDATEVRLWAGTDGTLAGAAEKNARSGMWHVSASDVYRWVPKSRKAHHDWRDALASLGSEVRAMIRRAEEN